MSWRTPTNPVFPKPLGSPRAAAVRMASSTMRAHQEVLYSALPNTLILQDKRGKRWLWEMAVEYQLEEVQFELSHRSHVQQGGWFNVKKKILATMLMWPNSMFDVRHRLEVLAERFPNESEADACQRLTKSQELLYEMKASELRYYRLLDECDELRTQRMFQAAQQKRVLGLRALSQSRDFYLQHLKLLLKAKLNGYQEPSPWVILDFCSDVPEGTTARLEKSYAGAPATDAALTTVADQLTCMDLQVLYLYSLLR